MDGFIDAMIQIREEAINNPEYVRSAPHNMPVKRLDDVKAARDLDLAFAAS
jgi:glycine dehydrogenase subunit 2